MPLIRSAVVPSPGHQPTIPVGGATATAHAQLGLERSRMKARHTNAALDFLWRLIQSRTPGFGRRQTYEMHPSPTLYELDLERKLVHSKSGCRHEGSLSD